MVDRIVLVSPVGISSTYDEYKNFNKMEAFIQKMCYKFNMTPSSGLSMLGFFSKIALNMFIERKFVGITDKAEYEVNRLFIHTIYKNRFTAEAAIFIFFNKNIQPYKPIIYHYDVLQGKKILMLYGDRDWVPMKPAEEMQRVLGSNVEIDTVSNSNHMVHVSNPEELASKVVGFLEEIC
jgi:pimeloyl-ACP methyl ester carboxylesterase